MSSIATAPSRTADQEPQNGKQPDLLFNPDATPTQDAPLDEPAAAGSNRTTIDEATRVERLISQLEARSMALVPYAYGSLRQVPPRKTNTGLLAGVLVALWLSSLVIAVAYIRYVNHSPLASERASATIPLIIPPDSDLQEQKVAATVDHLNNALVSSSQRINELQAALERSNRDLQRIAKKVNDEPVQPLSAKAATDSANIIDPNPVLASTLPKNWHRVLDLKPTEAAVPHKSADGAIDYWLVPRGTDPSPSKVLPIGTSAEGVVVHNLEDGKDYTLTPAGEWRTGALSSSEN